MATGLASSPEVRAEGRSAAWREVLGPDQRLEASRSRVSAAIAGHTGGRVTHGIEAAIAMRNAYSRHAGLNVADARRDSRAVLRVRL